MSQTEKKYGKIIPQYNGMLSDSLSWNQQSLDEISQKADLRTTIVIREGDATPQTTYEGVGDTLAWKRLATPSDLLRRAINRKGWVETTPVYSNARADIYINHHLLTQEVREKSKGAFDQELFVQNCDSLVRDGVGNILAQEKQLMTLRSAIILGLNATAIGIGAELTNLCFQGAFTGLFVSPPSEAFSFNMDVLDSYTNYYGSRLVENAFGVKFGAFTCFEALQMVLDGLKARRSNNPYVRGFQDEFNPIKPVKDYLAGYTALKLSSEPLVSLK